MSLLKETSLNPTVSVIIPNYNHARFLRERIDSVLGQTYQDFELILLDDASTDESAKVLEEYRSHPKVKALEINATNSGSTFRQWNKGIALCSGRYIWVAESDDTAEPVLLERLVSLLEANPNAGIAYCGTWAIDESGRKIGVVDDCARIMGTNKWRQDFCESGRDLLASYMVVMNVIPNASAVVFKKEVFVAAGGAAESMQLCGDWMLWSRMFANAGVCFIAEPLNHFRHHPISVRSETRRNLQRRENDIFDTLRVMAYILSIVRVPLPPRIRAMRRVGIRWIDLLNIGIANKERLETGRILRQVHDIAGNAFFIMFVLVLCAVRLGLNRRYKPVK